MTALCQQVARSEVLVRTGLTGTLSLRSQRPMLVSFQYMYLPCVCMDCGTL